MPGKFRWADARAEQRGAPGGTARRGVVVGSLARDRNEIGGRIFHRAGGAVWHAGTTLASLGVHTRVVTRIAAQDKDLAAELETAGVEVNWSPSSHTTIFVNRSAAENLDQRTQHVPALAEPIEPAEVSAVLEDADLAILGPLHPEDLADNILTAFDERRPPTVAVDVQGYTRVIRDGAIVPGLDHRLSDILAFCDVIKAGLDEAQLITGSRPGERAALQLARSCVGGEALVTCGASGAFIAHEGRVHHEPAVAVDVVDPTGAGDIFLAAYLAKRMQGAGAAAAAKFAANFTAHRLAKLDAPPFSEHE